MLMSHLQFLLSWTISMCIVFMTWFIVIFLPCSVSWYLMLSFITFIHFCHFSVCFASSCFLVHCILLYIYFGRVCRVAAIRCYTHITYLTNVTVSVHVIFYFIFCLCFSTFWCAYFFLFFLIVLML